MHPRRRLVTSIAVFTIVLGGVASGAPTRSMTTPPGSFAAGGAVVLAPGLAALRRFALVVRDIRSIRCTGYTADLGRGDTATARHLGLLRARAVCDALRDLGLRGAYSAVAGTPQAPAAANPRRVTVLVTHGG
jgi:outer membrane protein OmpA-like peptidoglycan-associated protein